MGKIKVWKSTIRQLILARCWALRVKIFKQAKAPTCT